MTDEKQNILSRIDTLIKDLEDEVLDSPKMIIEELKEIEEEIEELAE